MGKRKLVCTYYYGFYELGIKTDSFVVTQFNKQGKKIPILIPPILKGDRTRSIQAKHH